MDLFIVDMHSDMSDEPGPENEKKKSSITWTDSYIQGAKTDYIWGHAMYHNRLKESGKVPNVFPC
jgi:hypothetical protein